MKKILITAVLAIGMVATTYGNEKEVNIILEDNQLHFNYYSPLNYEGIIVDRLSQLVLVTEKGAKLTLSTDD